MMSHLLREEEILVFFTVLLICLPLYQCYAQPIIPFNFKCSENAKNTASIAFEANLHDTLDSLTEQGNPNRPFNTSFGENPDQVFGLVLCATNILGSVCRNCIRHASTTITIGCPMKKTAIIWNDLCLLHYSKEQLFPPVDFEDTTYFPGPNSISNPHDVEVSLFFFATRLSQTAALIPSKNKVARGVMSLGVQQNVSGKVQCIRDLSEFGCMRCLLQMVAAASSEPLDCGSNKTGLMLLGLRCQYELRCLDGLSDDPIVSPPPLPLMTVATPSRRKAGTNSISWEFITIVVSMTGAAVMLIYTVIICLLKRRKEKEDHRANAVALEVERIEPSESEIRQPITYDLKTLLTATSNFSNANKIGEGSFGHVYKGILLDGREIAVKRLLWNSVQALEQLKNEVALIAQLEHKNIVKLLGYCMEGDEKLLVYEYVSSNSLDQFIFVPRRRGQLGWDARYMIIKGIAQGLLRVHEGRLQRILHLDLKASNIILDGELCPKISELGFARFLRGNQTAGPHGCMAPEDVTREQFLVKTDVFSFGVLAIEIVKGRKRSDFIQSDCGPDLLHCTWKQFKDGRVLELMDPAIVESCSVTEMLRCIHIALLCIQENPADRPTMFAVERMLDGRSITQQPNSPPLLIVGSSPARSNPTSG